MKGDKMLVTEFSPNRFLVVPGSLDLEAFEKEVTNPPNWDVKDVASLIRHLLTTEADRLRLIYYE